MGMRAQKPKKRSNRRNRVNFTRKRITRPSNLNPFNMSPSQLMTISSNREGSTTNMPTNKKYRFVRNSGLNHLTFTPGTIGSNFITLSNVFVTDLTALFDEYRIMAATWKIWPDLTTVDSAEQIGGSQSDPGMFEMVVDYDDASIPLATDLLEYQTYRNFRFLGKAKPITSTIVPRLSDTFFKDAISSGYGSRARTWVDFASPDVPHYGWKYRFSSSITDAEHLFGYYSQVTLYLECRGVR